HGGTRGTGGTEAAGGIGHLPSGLLRVAAVGGACQILEFARDGFTSLVPPAGDDLEPQTESLIVDWTEGWSTFSEQPVRGLPAAGRAARHEPDRAPGPAEVLLGRIQEVCEIKYPRARKRVENGGLPSVLVSYHEGDAVRQLRVAAHVGTPTE